MPDGGRDRVKDEARWVVPTDQPASVPDEGQTARRGAHWHD